MPISQVASDLQGKGSLWYGDPCYDSALGTSHQECRKVTPQSLASQVLAHYGVGGGCPGDSCCPLDIINQDPFACINMSLLGTLVDGGSYTELYADENGIAKAVAVLPGQATKLPRIQYCTPSFQAIDRTDLVIVRSADPPPFRRCGKQWYSIVEGANNYNWNSANVFPGQQDPSSAKGAKFSWDLATSMQGADMTCDQGQFSQYGTVVYPDYERKQAFKDGVIDLVEIDGFEQILFWIVDINWDSDNLCSVQFTKSTDIPVMLGMPTNGQGAHDFGPTCAESSTQPKVAFYQLPGEDDPASESCSSVQSSLASAQQRQKWIMEWSEYSIPSFYGYGQAGPTAKFGEASKWSVGREECLGDAGNSMYESTSQVCANVTTLSDYNYLSLLDTTTVDFGSPSGGLRTIDLPRNICWIESAKSTGDSILYSFRAEAPQKASKKFWGYRNGASILLPWWNPFHPYMCGFVSNRFAAGYSNIPGQPDSTGKTYPPAYKYPGVLLGWDDTLCLASRLWAKIKISRPGISVQGPGLSVNKIIGSLRMRVMPVYQVDFPPAVGYAGKKGAGIIDPYKDLAQSNQAFCKALPGTLLESERLQELQAGTTLDITIPFLFPKRQGTIKSVSKGDFMELSTKCQSVASTLWGHIQQQSRITGYTYICGPPKNQSEVPRLGGSIDGRTVNSISYNYQDGSSFLVTVETGPVQVSQASAGAVTRKRTKGPIELKGKVVNQGYGALYKVNVGSLGVITAWNIDKYPYDVGDEVQVTLHNHPAEV